MTFKVFVWTFQGFIELKSLTVEETTSTTSNDQRSISDCVNSTQTIPQGILDVDNIPYRRLSNNQINPPRSNQR